MATTQQDQGVDLDMPKYWDDEMDPANAGSAGYYEKGGGAGYNDPRSITPAKPVSGPENDWTSPNFVPFAGGMSAGGAPSPAQLIANPALYPGSPENKAGSGGVGTNLDGTPFSTPTTNNGAGNSTATTAPPPTPLGGNVPAYAANYTNYAWMNGAVQAGTPGANTQITAPTSMGGNYDAIPQYDANGVLIPTWENPNMTSAAAHTALNQVLSGDASGMDSDAIKNKQKEAALQMQKDTMNQSRQAAAGRGMLDSGYQSGQERRIGNETQKNILGGFRDVDIKAAENATANKIAASTALSNVLGQDYSNASIANTAGLANATQQDSQNRWAAEHGLAVEDSRTSQANDLFNAQNDAAGTNLESWKAGNEATEQARQDDLDVAKARTTELIARLGLAVNMEELAQSSMETKTGFLVNLFQILVEQEQANAQIGVQYAQMGMSADQLIQQVATSLGMG